MNASRRTRRSYLLLFLIFALLTVSTGCATWTEGSSAAGTPVVDESLDGFESFSGMTLPPGATNVSITASVDDTGRPTYLVSLDLPTDQVDQFCRDGHMSRPLHVITIPDSTRKTFDYQGDSSSGVRIGEASLPSNVAIQREVFATGTHSPIAHVQVHAYALGR